jgi:cytochrome P450
MAHSPIVFVAAGAFLSYILYTRITLYLARRRFQKEHGCKPNPHVFHKDPILGLDVMHIMTKNHRNHVMLEENKKRFERMGNTFHTRLGATPTIATIEPENIKTILSLKFKDFSIGNRTASFTPLLGHGIFNADGERWASSRHLLRPSFSRDQIADLEAFERHFKIMLRHIPKNGATVDLQELFFHLSIDTASEFLFNHSANTLRMVGQDGENNEDVIFAKAFSIAQDDIVTRVRLGPIDRFRKKTKETEAIQICHAYVDKYVDVALRYRKDMNEEKEVGSQQEERYVFIQELAKQTTDRNRLRDELLNILLAGRDTTASLLSNMFFCLAKDPAVYAKLRAEVAQLEGRVPTYEELRNFKYLKWCLNECKFSAGLSSLLLTCGSPAPASSGPWKLALLYPRHRPTAWRRRRRQVPSLRSQRHQRWIFALCDAQTRRHIRSRCQ